MKAKELRNEDILYADVEESIDRIKRKKTKYVLFHQLLKSATFFGGAIITILAGWDKPPTYLIFTISGENLIFRF